MSKTMLMATLLTSFSLTTFFSQATPHAVGQENVDKGGWSQSEQNSGDKKNSDKQNLLGFPRSLPALPKLNLKNPFKKQEFVKPIRMSDLGNRKGSIDRTSIDREKPLQGNFLNRLKEFDVKTKSFLMDSGRAVWEFPGKAKRAIDEKASSAWGSQKRFWHNNKPGFFERGGTGDDVPSKEPFSLKTRPIIKY